MPKIIALSANELDSYGIPFAPVALEYIREENGGCWIASCSELPGYLGYADKQAEALRKLHGEFETKPILRVTGLKLRSIDAEEKAVKVLASKGGADAPSEALQYNGNPLTVQPNKLFSLRKEARAAREELGFSFNPEWMALSATLAAQMERKNHREVRRWKHARHLIAKARADQTSE